MTWIDITTRYQLAMQKWLNEGSTKAWLELKDAEAAKDAMDARHKEQMLLATSRRRKVAESSE